MSTPFSSAIAAYGNTAQLIGDPTKSAGMKAPEGGPDFGEMLADTVQSVVDTGNRADALSMQMMDGNASVVDVVTAVAETEVAVEGMVAIRDRVISAYEEIMRMPI